MTSTISSVRHFGGTLLRLSHPSTSTQSTMTLSLYLPSTPPTSTLYYLSGLTCNDMNVRDKGGFAEAANEQGVAIVMPDTSPRGNAVEGDDDSYDFGTGAGFYVNATTPAYRDAGYRMDDYVNVELPALIPTIDATLEGLPRGITGHSMGGHGALTSFFRNPGTWQTCSAFAPIVNPTQVPWGRKAFEGYLGGVDAGRDYDACELARGYEGEKVEILVSQGTADAFLEEQLKTDNLVEACKEKDNVEVVVKLEEGYDHSYSFISSFARQHVEWHASRVTK